MSWSVQQLFDELVQLGESPCIEAKQANEIGPSVMQTICAFANKPGLGGGWLLLGVAKPDFEHNTFWISGVEYIDKHLAPMCEEGLIAYKFPEVRNHPHQAYIITELIDDKH